MSARALLACVAIVATTACSSEPRVPFRVITLGDDPFFGGTATAIAVTIERNGVRDPASLVRFGPDATALRLVPMPFGTGYDLVVETELSGIVLARGRSFPFSVTSSGADHRPDVSLGVLGRFASVGMGDASDPFSFATPSDDGALLASRAGLARFVAHGTDGRPRLDARVPWPASRVGGAFAAMDGGVLVVGGAAAGATLVDAHGAMIAELSATQLPIARGAALAPVDAATVLVIGGTRGDGSIASDVSRIAWDGTSLSVATLTPLPVERTGARSLTFHVRSGPDRVPRVLVLDGASSAAAATDVVLVDPDDATPPRSVVLPAPVTNAAASELDTGLVLLAGGLDATATATGQVTILVVQLDATPPIRALSPSPPPLFRARESAIALSLGTGLALIVGGRDATATPVDEAEIAEVQLDSLPGSVVLTGSLASAGNITAGTTLLDHTLLVASDGALSLYFSPRGE